jgi:hypothetical protein
MIVYTKCKGNNEKYILDHDRKSVIFPSGEHIVSASVAVYTETDERLLIEKYNDFRRIYHQELISLYRTEKYEPIKYFLYRVLNSRNFVLSITSKYYVLSKMLYFIMVGRQAYMSRPGYSLSFISDLARMKDELIYPLLFTSANPSDNNFKVVLKNIINCPYYLTDFHNFFKKDVHRIYWTNHYENYIAELEKFDLDDEEYFDQYMTGYDFSNVVERLTSGLKFASASEVKFIHDTEYKYDKSVMKELSINKIHLEYQEKKSHPFLLLVDDLSTFVYTLLKDCLQIVYENKPYDNEKFNLLSMIFENINQENIEFQIPNSTWSTLVGLVDLCNVKVSEYFKQNEVVDNVIILKYTRINEYLKNHYNDKRAFNVFKYRV